MFVDQSFGGLVVFGGDFEEGAFFASGLFLELVGGSDGDDFSEVDHGESVAVFGFVHVVGGEQEGDSEFTGEEADDFPESFAGEGIDAAGGFVEEEDVGQVDHGAGEAEALFESDGQFVGEAVFVADEADDFE